MNTVRAKAILRDFWYSGSSRSKEINYPKSSILLPESGSPGR